METPCLGRLNLIAIGRQRPPRTAGGLGNAPTQWLCLLSETQLLTGRAYYDRPSNAGRLIAITMASVIYPGGLRVFSPDPSGGCWERQRLWRRGGFALLGGSW